MKRRGGKGREEEVDGGSRDKSVPAQPRAQARFPPALAHHPSQ